MSKPKFPTIVFWEMLENAPMLIGIIIAVRLWAGNPGLALVCLLLGAALGAGLIHFTEIKKYSNQPTLKETLVNFSVFTVLTVPVVFYFSTANAWWSNWGVDILLGGIAGGALAIGESWGWKNTATVKIHIVSMSIAAILFLLGIRVTSQVESLAAIFVVGVVFNFFVSATIVWFDYWPVMTAPSGVMPPTGQLLSAKSQVGSKSRSNYEETGGGNDVEKPLTNA